MHTCTRLRVSVKYDIDFSNSRLGWGCLLDELGFGYAPPISGSHSSGLLMFISRATTKQTLLRRRLQLPAIYIRPHTWRHPARKFAPIFCRLFQFSRPPKELLSRLHLRHAPPRPCPAHKQWQLPLARVVAKPFRRRPDNRPHLPPQRVILAYRSGHYR